MKYFGNHETRYMKVKEELQLTKTELDEITKKAKEQGFEDSTDYLRYLHNKFGHHAVNYQSNTGGKSIAPQNEYEVAYETELGRIYQADSSLLMRDMLEESSIDLIMTSPPFGLVRKKDYGNEDADEYIRWFHKFAHEFRRVLKDSGSLVIDIGGAWKKGQPTRSLYHFELLIMLCRDHNFHLVQEYFWWNPAKLPTPAEWVNVRRVRVKDAINCVWWLSKTPYPKAANRRVLQPYSDSMKSLLKNGYKAKMRPSGHDISDKFQLNNKGAIPPNLIAIANTESNSSYQRYCRSHGIKEHPARFPSRLPAYFLRMLTDKGDIVFDPFGGSCVTGAVAEAMERQWICSEVEKSYIDGAKGRFENIGDTRAAIFSRNDVPYKIYAPVLDISSEEETPLVKDGGKNRQKLKYVEA